MSVDLNKLKRHMIVKDLNGKNVATIDSTQGSVIKLAQDDEGRHHWISTAMVERIDDEVHLNADEKEMMEVWVSEDPNPPRKRRGRLGGGPGRTGKSARRAAGTFALMTPATPCAPTLEGFETGSSLYSLYDPHHDPCVR